MTTAHERSHSKSGRIGLVVAALLLTVAACGASGSSLGDQDDGSAGASTGAAVDPTDPSTTRPAALETGSHAHTVTVDETPRLYRTYVPQRSDPSEPMALVVMLHGGFASASQAEGAYDWNAEADEHGFAVVYPEGVSRAWNAGSCCGRHAGSPELDDVSFITTVVDVVSQQLPIDPRRVYATGMSNGAMMSLRLACESDVFAAVAPVAGAQMVPCASPNPTSVLQIHGMADDNVPFDGSLGDGRGEVPVHTPIDESIEAWRSVDQCDPATVTTTGVVTRSESTCADGRAVDLVTVEDAGHQWPGSTKRRPVLSDLRGADEPSPALNATDEIWAFFDAHPAPA